MKKEIYPPLGHDKILDAPQGLDPDDLGERRPRAGERSRKPFRPAGRRGRKILRWSLPFLLGLGVGWAIYANAPSREQQPAAPRPRSSLFAYPVAGLGVERASRGDAGEGDRTVLLIPPGESLKIRYGHQSLRFIAVERQSSLWASLMAALVAPPALYLGDRPLEPGQELTALLEPERALSYGLTLRPSPGRPPVASFRLELEMDGGAWLARARALKDPQSQKACLEQALENEPENIDVFLALGNLLWEQKDATGAAQQYQEVLKRRPDHVEAAQALATIYWKSQPKKALEVYEGLVKSDPARRVDHLKQVARLQERLGISSAETYRKILSIHKNDPDAVKGLDNLYSKELGRAQELEKRGDLHKAIQEMKQAMELHPTKEGRAYLATLYNNLAFSLAQKGKHNEAIPHYEASLKLDENAVTCLNLADAYVKTNQIPNALKTLEKAQSLKTKDPDVAKNLLLLWAELLMAKKDFAQAASKLDELSRRFPKDTQVAKLLGMALWQKGDLHKALEVIKRLPAQMASQPAKERAEVYRTLGDLYRSLGDQEKDVKARIARYDEALKAYKEGLSLSKGDKELQKRRDDLEKERTALRIRALRSS
jgi:tetratricopeptide (TPR) repeat protein